jgi:hypothetical protein
VVKRERKTLLGASISYFMPSDSRDVEERGRKKIYASVNYPFFELLELLAYVRIYSMCVGRSAEEWKRLMSPEKYIV